MQNQHLISYKDEFSHIAEESIKLCRKYEKTNQKIKSVADRIEKNVDDRFRDFTPKIMVYGIYNAGKSTILNALIGEEKAAMADVPTTKIVQEYHWKEYTIYDTPGIGAPEEEEERVSREQLQKCDVILFVTDTEGGFTLGKNYQELIDIVKSGKRLLIVLNNKSGSDFMAVEQVKGEIYLQFAEAYGKATPEELAKSVSIILVNARNALDARTKYTGKGREKMLEKSNIAELEEAIIQEYGKANGFTILNELAIQLNNALEELLSLLENSIKDKDGKQSEESKIREGLRDLQDNLIMKVTEYVHDSADDLDSRVLNVMLKVIDEREVDSDEIKEGIQEEVKQWAEQINGFVDEVRKKISPRYRELIGKFNEEMKIKSGEIGSIDLPDTLSSGDLETESTKIDASAIGGNKDMGEIGKKVAMDTAVIGGGVTSLLSVVASSSVTWLASAASAMVPYVAPIVGLISLFVRIFGDDDDAENTRRMEEIRAENEAERRRAIQKERLMRELKEKSRRLSRKISSSMISNVSDIISNWFALVMEQIDKSIAGNSKEKEAINNDIRAAEQLKAQLDNQISAYRNM